MSQGFEYHARLLFTNEYEQVMQQLKSELGSIINKHNINGILVSSIFFSDLWKIASTAARQLSKKRLDIDLDSLRKFNVSVKQEAEWLKSNQYELLMENFWKQFILTEYQRPIFNGHGRAAENHMWNELQNILSQAERNIIALTTVPEPSITPHEKPHTVNHYHNSQVNIAHDQAAITATQITNNGIQFEQVANKFIEFLQASNISHDLKVETIELVEATTEEIKSNKPRKGILKALGANLKSIKEIVSGTKSLADTSVDLINSGNQLLEMINPLITS